MALALEKIRKILSKYALFIIPVTILLPGFEIAGINLRVENFLALAVVPFLVRKAIRKEWRVNLVDLGFIFLSLSFLVTILYSYIFRGVPFAAKDFFDVFRVFNYYLLYQYCITFFDGPDLLKRFKRCYMGTFLVVLFVALAQFFNILGVNKLLHYYTSYFHARGVWRAGRVIATFGHTNEFAIFTGIFVIFIVSLMLYGKYGNQIETKKRIALKIAFLFFAFFCLFATMSRSVLVGVFLGLGATLFFHLVFSRTVDRVKRTIYVVGVILLTSFSAFGLIRYTATTLHRVNVLDRFESGFNEISGQEDEGALQSISFSKRMGQWVAAIDVIGKSPILGYGPSKATKGTDGRPTIVENEYLGIMMNYGLVGLVSYLYLYLIVIRTLFRAFVRKKDNLELAFSYWLLGSVVAILLYNIFLGIFFRTQAFNIFMILLGLIVLINKDDVDIAISNE